MKHAQSTSVRELIQKIENHPEPNPIVRTGRPVTTEQTSRSSAQEIDTRFLLGCESTNVSVERSDKDKDADENVDADRVRTGRPVGSEQSVDLFTQCEEIDIDFRVSGLPHAVVKQAENFRVREIVNKIESHPHRHALQRDLQQNEACNPFSTTTKQMIQDVGSVELFELFETDPKTQCTECLSYWSEGIVYCTCGHLLKEFVANRSFTEYTLDLLSIRPHGHRYWKTPEKKENHLVHNLKTRCVKRKFTGIHAEQDFTFRMSESEYFSLQTKLVDLPQ